MLDDVRHAAVLENPAVRGAAEQPQPGPQADLVTGELAISGALAAAADDAVEVALAAVMQLQRQAHGLAQQLVELDRRVLGDQLQFVLEDPSELLAAPQALQDQHVLPERTADLNQARTLCDRHRYSGLAQSAVFAITWLGVVPRSKSPRSKS
ncbi:hypothetical protein D9M70_542430 [compost metagenome]